jgi:hypothetical protein
MSVSMADAKKHPMFTLLSLQMGEEKAAMLVKQTLEEQAKANQAITEFSKEEKKIILPIAMNKLQGSKELKRQWDDEETEIEVVRKFEDWNWKDVLVAVKKATERHFGWIQGKTIMTFFGPERPKEISIVVQIADGKKITEDCFYGAFTATVWEDAQVDVGAQHIVATVKKRYADEVREYFDLVQTILDQESIYRAKPITVTKQTSPWGEVSLDFEIFELKVSDRIVLNEDVETVIQNFVIDDLGDEGKRCYLFSGGYGNAKTETAMRVGGQGTAKGMSFFYCKDADVFHMLLKQAVNYQPCIVFLEDLDEIGAGEKRDADMNRILNTLDGVQTKGNNLTVIFTTNHEKRINPALRRPGRIDLVIHFDNPSKIAVAAIYKCYLGGMAGSEGLDYAQLAERTPECPGAVVAEIAKRAVKLCKKRGEVKEEFIKASVDSMKHHLKLMKEDVENVSTGEMVIALRGASIQVKDLNGESKMLEKHAKA